MPDELRRPGQEGQFRLHPSVRLRGEAFGGIAFHRQSGRLLEVDYEAFALLGLLASGPWTLRSLASAARALFARHVAVSEIAGAVAALARREIVEELRPPDDVAMVEQRRFALPATGDDPAPDAYTLSSPVTVHWAISNRCGLACPHCHASSHAAVGELSRAEKLRVVERLSGWGVLEVALGGGEPTVSPDLGDILLAIRAEGMVPNITTNGQCMTRTQARALAESCGCVQLSLDHPDILDAYRGTGVTERALATVSLLHDAGVPVGANLLLVPENMRAIEPSLAFIERAGIRRVTLLRPFGDAGGRWRRGWPGAADWDVLRSSILAWVAREPTVTLELACGLSFLLDELASDQHRPRLIFGCAGGRRLVALQPDGAIYPCSHLSSLTYRMGHILKDDLPTMWRQARRADVRWNCPAA